MEYLKIANWKRWQTARKDRPDWQPPWIKLHRRLMRNPEWISLSDHQKGQLVCLWLLAADHGGKIPNSEHHLERVLCFSKKLNLQVFIDTGFIEPCPSTVGQLSDKRGQVSSKIRLDKSRLDKRNPPIPPQGGENGFQVFWEAYPRKVGKLAAQKSWNRLRPTKELQQRILDSVAEHRYSHDWTRDQGRFIPYPATFLNQGRWDDEVAAAPSTMSDEERLKEIERRGSK